MKKKSLLTEIMRKEKRTEEDFSKTLSLLNKYKLTFEATFKKQNSLSMFPMTP